MSSKIYYFDKNRDFTNDELEELKNYEILHLGKEFDKSIDNLPNNIKKIQIDYSCNFNQPINYLPYNLESLDIASNCFDQSLDFLPLSLKNLRLYLRYPFEDGNKFNNLPPNLEYLSLISSWNKYHYRINFENRLYNLNNLPNNLKVLEITSNTYEPIETLPESLETLSINCEPELNYEGEISIHLPTKLDTLILNYYVYEPCYKTIIKDLFNNTLTCKNLLLNEPYEYSNSYIKSLEYIKHKFPHIIISSFKNYESIIL